MLERYTDSELHQMAHRFFDLLARQDDVWEQTNMQVVISCVCNEIVRRAFAAHKGTADCSDKLYPMVQERGRLGRLNKG